MRKEKKYVKLLEGVKIKKVGCDAYNFGDKRTSVGKEIVKIRNEYNNPTWAEVVKRELIRTERGFEIYKADVLVYVVAEV